jgi:hypothetical protein
MFALAVALCNQEPQATRLRGRATATLDTYLSGGPSARMVLAVAIHWMGIIQFARNETLGILDG